MEEPQAERFGHVHLLAREQGDEGTVGNPAAACDSRPLISGGIQRD